MSVSSKRKTFCEQCDQVIDDYKLLLAAIKIHRRVVSLTRQVSPQIALTLVVLWENYISELLLEYIVAEPKRCLSTKKNSITKSVEERYGKTCVSHVKCEFPTKPSINMIKNIVDKNGMNITCKNAEELKNKANTLLSGSDASKFTMSREDTEFYDFVIKLRNYLGHRSDKSRRELSKHIDTIKETNNAYLKARIEPIGKYLSAIINNQTRLEIIGTRLSELARRL